MSEPSRQRVVILISGRGSNMLALIQQSREPSSSYWISKVFADRTDAAGLTRARELGIAALALPVEGTDRSTFENRLAAAIHDCSPTLIVLAGFMRILSVRFVAQFAGKMLNIHPSLLPQYPGLHTHRHALAAGDAQHGATVHFVTEQLDAGPAVIQARVPVHVDDDEASLAARVQSLEHKIYPLAVRWFCEGRLRYGAHQAWLDGKALLAPVQYSGDTP